MAKVLAFERGVCSTNAWQPDSLQKKSCRFKAKTNKIEALVSPKNDIFSLYEFVHIFKQLQEEIQVYRYKVSSFSRSRGESVSLSWIWLNTLDCSSLLENRMPRKETNTTEVKCCFCKILVTCIRLASHQTCLVSTEQYDSVLIRVDETTTFWYW